MILNQNQGLNTSDATATAADIVIGKTAYANGAKLTGIHTCPQGLDTSDATATAADIVIGKTAYINGASVTGTFELGKAVPFLFQDFEALPEYSYLQGSL